MILMLVLASGCDIIPQFEQIKQQYLGGRVEELLTAMPTAAQKPMQSTPTVGLPTIEPTEDGADVTATETPQPESQPTPTITPTVDSDDPAVYLGEPAWKDTMDEAKYWPVGGDQYSTAYFENGYMRMTVFTTYDAWRLATTSSLGNNYIETTFIVETCSGSDHYGIMFRVPDRHAANRGYLFGVTCDGRYSLREWDATLGDNGLMVYLVRWVQDGNINTGSNQTNRVGIMTIDDRLIMFINGVQVDEFSDDTFPEGSFGVFVGSDVTEKLTVKIQEVSYWSNPTLP